MRNRKSSRQSTVESEAKRLSPSLPASMFRARRDRLSEVLEARGIDAYFLSGKADLFYLTGFLSEGFYGLVTPRGFWLFASALLADQLRPHASGCRLVVGKRLIPSLGEIASKFKLKRMGFDGEGIDYRLGSLLVKAGFRTEDNPVAGLRVIKDAEEAACLRRACALTSHSIGYIQKRLRPGVTEKQLAVDLEVYFYRNGAERTAFDLIVAMGPHTALPHHIPTARRLKPNEPVLFDIGCTVGGYRSDLTRTLAFGKMPKRFQTIYEIVRASQQAGIESAKAGLKGGDVDAAARRVITKAGYGRYFVHSTGHGVGIDIHEPPWIRPKSDDLLRPGMVMTVEPGIYLPGLYGVRIEDTLLIGEDGHDILTRPDGSAPGPMGRMKS